MPASDAKIEVDIFPNSSYFQVEQMTGLKDMLAKNESKKKITLSLPNLQSKHLKSAFFSGWL